MKKAPVSPEDLGGPSPFDANNKLDAGRGATQDNSASSVTKAPVGAMAVGEDDEEDKDKAPVTEDDLDIDDLGLDIEFSDDDDFEDGSDFEVTDGEPYDPNAPTEFESDDEDKDKEPMSENDDKDDDDVVTEGEHEADCACVVCKSKVSEEADEDDEKAVSEADDEDEDKPWMKESDDEDDDKKAVSEADDEDDEKKAVSEDDDEDKDKAPVAESRLKIRMSVKKDVQALMAADSTLSEGFKSKAAVIFESALKSKITGITKALKENYGKRLKRQRRINEAKVVKQVDRFLNHIVEEWMKENSVAIETGLRAELVDDFMVGLKRLFQEHYIDVPQSKVNVVESMNKQVEALTAQINKSERERVRLKEELVKRDRRIIESRVLNTVAVSERVKIQKLTEQVSYENAAQFEAAIKTLVEGYTVKATPKAPKQSAESGQADFLKEEKKITGTAAVPEMAAIAGAVKRVMSAR